MTGSRNRWKMTEATKELDFEAWLQYGVDNGYCSEQFCSTHDAPPTHPSEDKEWEKGGDPCLHVVRLGSVDDWEI